GRAGLPEREGSRAKRRSAGAEDPEHLPSSQSHGRVFYPQVNRTPPRGVLPDDAAMNDDVAQLAGAFVTSDRTTDETFEARLADSSRLAFRVAYSVLRHRQDAEDAAQDALVKAYRKFAQLRDRDRFRAWLVRTTWRLALDRRRGDKRREAREQRDAPARIGIGEAGSARDEPVDDLVARERAAHLWRAIDALPEKLRVV